MVMAEIGGHLAHQLPNLHNHTQSGLQPSLVMNHHLELDCHGHDVIKKQRLSLCVGCGGQIHDQYILRVAPDLEWHAACLKCQECRQFLDESCTCFVRDGKTYCKRDYVRLFGTKCDKCGNSFSKNDFVMRAKTKIFHIECFRCSACARQLLPGDEFALRDGGILYCKEDHDVLEKSSQSSLTSSSIESNNNNSSSNNNNTSLSNNNHSSELGSMSDFSISFTDSGSESGSHKSIREKRPSGPSDGKPTRVRTVLNEKQLHTLRTCYNANPRPDALMKEQLVEMTGLSPRVIRVWFQNKRCKDKKKTIQMKLQMQQEKEGRKLGYGAMQGIPMIASSPVRHDSPLNLQGIDVQTYQPPWKALSDFALHADLDSNGAINTHTPAFQQLVNQMHGYDLNGMPPLPPHQQQGPHPPPPGQQMNGPPIGSMDSGITSHHHPDSTDSYVTYLESDDKSKLALTPTSSMSLSMSSSSSLSSASTSAATSIASPPSASNTAGALLGSAAAAGAIGGLGVGGVVAAACALNPGLALGGMAVGGGGGGGVVGSLGVGNTASCGQAQSATEQLMQMLQKVTASPTHAVL